MFYCPLPFVSESYDIGLKRRLCCHDNLGQLQDGLSGFEISEIREKIKQGNVPGNCLGCKRLEEQTGNSPRKYYLNKFDKTFDDSLIQYLDLTIDNTCNLECTTCTPSYSSRLHKLYNKMNIAYELHGDNDSSNELENIKKKLHERLSPNATILITGGEPSISNKCHDFVDWLIKNFDTSDMTLRFFTNGTNGIWFQKYLDQFKSIHLEVSIDGHKELFEYIRYPGKWNTIKKNLKTYSDLTSIANFNFSIHTVYSSLNFWCLSEMITELVSIAKIPQMIPVLTKLESPQVFNIDHLPDKIFNHYVNRQTLNINDTLNDFMNEDMKERLHDILSFLNNTRVDNKKSYYIEMLSFLKRMDNFKSKKYTDVLIYTTKESNDEC